MMAGALRRLAGGPEANIKSIAAVSKQTKCHYVKKEVNSGGTMNGKVFDGFVNTNTLSFKSTSFSLRQCFFFVKSFLKQKVIYIVDNVFVLYVIICLVM